MQNGKDRKTFESEKEPKEYVISNGVEKRLNRSNIRLESRESAASYDETHICSDRGHDQTEQATDSLHKY